MSEADLEDLEDLDEDDIEANIISADVDSAGQLADDQRPPTSIPVCHPPSHTLFFEQWI